MAPPKKATQEQLKRVSGLVKESARWRSNEGYDDLWTRMVDLYRGKQHEGTPDQHRMLVNLAFATKNVIAPSVAINNPKFTVAARKPEFGSQAIITEQVLNYLWRANKYQEEFRMAVDDFLTVGHGWIKVGYKATKPKNLVKIEDRVDDSDEDEGVDDRDETVPGNVESEVRNLVDGDRPFAERVSFMDMFVDPTARHPREMKWICQRVKRPFADVVVDERYEQRARNKISASAMHSNDDDTRASEFGIEGSPEGDTEHLSYVDVYEYYDIRKGTVCTFALECNEYFLIEPQPMPYSFGHPFVMLRNYDIPDFFYPMGELESMEPLQHELNETRTDLMTHRKKYQRKVLYNKDAFDDDGVQALMSDKDNTMVPVDLNAAQTALGDVVAPMPQEMTPPDFYSQSAMISEDIDRVTGVSDYMRGAQAEIRRTATEAAMIQDAQNARAADKLGRIEGVLAQIGERLISLMQQYMTGEIVTRIVGLTGQQWLGPIDVDYIKGEFDFEVEAGSTVPRNESFRRQAALQFVDAIGPFIQMGVIDPMAAARRVLQDGFDIKDPDSFLLAPQPQVDPMTGQPLPQQPGMPPQQGAPTPPMGGGGAPPEGGGEPAESPIAGIPPGLVNQLMSQQGLSPN